VSYRCELHFEGPDLDSVRKATMGVAKSNPVALEMPWKVGEELFARLLQQDMNSYVIHDCDCNELFVSELRSYFDHWNLTVEDGRIKGRGLDMALSEVLEKLTKGTPE